MALLVHHSGGRNENPSRTETILRALLTLVLVTAVIAAGAGLAAYAVSKVLVSQLR
jgi:hypothetical protein